MENLRPLGATSASCPPPSRGSQSTESSEIRDEGQLIASILAGKTGLYHDLVQPYEARVYRMAFKMLRNQADAEDAAQETFLRAYRKLASFRFECKFSTWLTSIVLNEARGRLRSRKDGLTVSLDFLLSQAIPSSAQYLRDKHESALQDVERAELRFQLHRAISDLPPIYREVLQMRLFDERSVRNTAQALRSTEGAVKARLHRARRMLRTQFNTREPLGGKLCS